jgi:D-alanyl-D-alanine carboxypeptidase
MVPAVRTGIRMDGWQGRRVALSLFASVSLIGGVVVLGGCGGDETTTTAAAAPDGPLPESTQRQLETAVRKSFPEAAAPGAVVAVQTPEGKWIKTIGVADDRTGEPMEADLHTRIGSVTKTFTGTVLMQLVGEGKVSLDDPIADYVPDVPRGEKITVEQVAEMISGIASYTLDSDFTDLLFTHPEKVWTPEELLKIGLDEPASFKPGTHFEYSNTNTVLLGKVIEDVTGKPIGEVFRERIFEPLGLTETSWPGKSPKLPEPYAHGYTLQGQPPDEPADATHWNPSWGWTAGEIISTADDLLVYGRALGTGEGLLSPELQEERLASLNTDIPPLSERFRYGITLTGDGGWIGHTGSLPGYNTTVYYHAEIDTTAVVETNSDIASGGCKEQATLTEANLTLQDVECASPADRIMAAVAKALGQPYHLLPG